MRAKSFFIRQDGSLKTGWMTLSILVLILGAACLLFQVKDQAILVETIHLFSPQSPEQPAPQVTHASKPPAEKPVPQVNQSPKPPAEKPVPQVTRAPEPSADQPALQVPRSRLSDVPSGPQQSEKALASVPRDVVKVEKQTRTVTVSRDLYPKILQAWIALGREEETEELPLRVANLSKVYPLFQMKPVAVKNHRYVDLNDNTQIGSQTLEKYSATVFVAADPWTDWEKQLVRAGFNSQGKVEVRYYMYPFIRNSIYRRASQAFAHCKAKKLIPAQVKPSQVDILGQTYIVKKAGGGEIGVFVPVSITTREAAKIPVPPDCFADQADVRLLMESGVL